MRPNFLRGGKRLGLVYGSVSLALVLIMAISDMLTRSDPCPKTYVIGSRPDAMSIIARSEALSAQRDSGCVQPGSAAVMTNRARVTLGIEPTPVCAPLPALKIIPPREVTRTPAERFSCKISSLQNEPSARIAGLLIVLPLASALLVLFGWSIWVAVHWIRRGFTRIDE